MWTCMHAIPRRSMARIENLLAVLLALTLVPPKHTRATPQHDHVCHNLGLRGGQNEDLRAKMSVADLRNLCKSRGMPSVGKKADLLLR
jgi:hypothetical protein